MNARDALAQLKDIHLPEPVPAWPPAPGWWLLAGLLFALLLWVILRLRSWRRQTRAQRAARRELAALTRHYRKTGDAPALVRALSVLLRRTALSYADPAAVAGLTGTSWLQFLDRIAGGTEFSAGPGAVLAQGPYQPTATVDGAALLDLCQRWLQRLPKEACRV